MSRVLRAKAAAALMGLALGAPVGAETLKGRIWDIQGSMLTVEERAVKLSPAVRIERADQPDVRASDLRVGWEVEVEGDAAEGGVLEARRVKVLTRRRTPVRLEGFVERTDAGFLYVDGRPVAWPKDLPRERVRLGMELHGEGTLDDEGVVSLERWSLEPRRRGEDERAFLERASGELATLKSQLRTISERSLQEYVAGVGRRVAPAYLDRSENPLSFYVVDDPEPNAFSLPDGTIVVHTGLIALLENEAQLAAVLGHEIAHVTHKHGYRNHKTAQLIVAVGVGTQAAAVLLMREASPVARVLASLGAGLALTAAVNGYGRDREDDADRVGLRYAFEAGYDPFQAVEVWRILSRYLRERGKVSNWFFGQHSTHRERIGNLTREINLRYRGRVQASALARNEKPYRQALRRHAAMVEYARGDYARAERMLRQMLDEDLGDALAHLYLGNVYRALDPSVRSERALAQYERARALDPELPFVYRELGSYFYGLGDYGRAVEGFEAYLRKAPDAVDAADVRDQLRSSRALSGVPEAVPVEKATWAESVSALRQPDVRAREEAVQAIRRMGPQGASAVPALLVALDDADPGVRTGVVRALGFLGPAARPAVSRLVGLLQTGDPPIRLTVVDALGGIGAEAVEAVPDLVAALSDERLRARAAAALGRIGPGARRAGISLAGVLRSRSSGDRVSAAIALGEIGVDAATSPVVVVALGLALKDENTSVRQQSALALAKLGPQARLAVPALIEALRGDNPFVYPHAAHALGEMGETARVALPALREKLSDEEPGTRSAAVDAIRKIEKK